MNSDLLHQRLRRMRAQAAIRKWEARQVDHARGVWFRLELLLARTRCALVISADESAILRAAGFEAHPVGAELEPPKALFVVPEEMLPPSIEGHEIPLQDARQILLASAVVLIPFR
jgi:hypothetical protein